MRNGSLSPDHAVVRYGDASARLNYASADSMPASIGSPASLYS